MLVVCCFFTGACCGFAGASDKLDELVRIKEKMDEESIIKVESDVKRLNNPEISKALESQREIYDKRLKAMVNDSLSAISARDDYTQLKDILSRHPLNHDAVFLVLCCLKKQKDFPLNAKRMIIQYIIESAVNASDENLICPDSLLLLSFIDNADLLNDRSRELLKNLLLSKRNVPVFLCDFFDLGRNPEIAELLRNNIKGFNAYEPVLSSLGKWKSLCLLARKGDPEAVAQAKRIATSSDSENAYAMLFIPYGLAYTEQPELIALLFDMLKSNKVWDNGEDCMPQQTKIAHKAAAALSLVVSGFPKYNAYLEFTDDDKKKCIEWVKAHKDDYKVIKHPSGFYLDNACLGLDDH